MEMDRISVTVTGANRVELAGKLRAFADNFDGTPAGADGKVTKSAKTTKAAQVETTDEDDDFGKADKKTKETKASKAAAASFEEDDATEETVTETAEVTESEDDFMDAAPKAAAKKTAKKLTVNDVNTACKEKAAATDRKTVLSILKKKFNVASVTELKAEQYGDVIKAMAV